MTARTSIGRRAAEAMNAMRASFAAEDAAQELDDWRTLMRDARFRRVLAAALSSARVFGAIDAAEPNAAMRALGRRDMGLALLAAARRADGEMAMRSIAERDALERERAERLEALARGEGKETTT